MYKSKIIHNFGITFLKLFISTSVFVCIVVMLLWSYRASLILILLFVLLLLQIDRCHFIRSFRQKGTSDAVIRFFVFDYFRIFQSIRRHSVAAKHCSCIVPKVFDSVQYTFRPQKSDHCSLLFPFDANF